MARKRAVNEVENAAIRPRREAPKRTKLSSTVDMRSNSSVPSSCSVSEDSALSSTPPRSPETHTRKSSISSVQSSGHNDYDSTDSSSGSDDDSSDADSNGDDIVTIGGPKKPPIDSNGGQRTALDLKARLASFLPQMAAANDELAKGMAGQSMEDVNDEEPHIQMNLGLGVLEEKQDGYSSSSDESSDSNGDQQGEDIPVSSGAVRREAEKERDVMGKLLGRNSSKQKVGIQEVDQDEDL